MRSQAILGLEASKTLNKSEVKAKKPKTKSNAVSDKKCNICESNSRELNSFKCSECDNLFHKQCVNKRTSVKEFALLKKGDLTYNCETCIQNRVGIEIVENNMNKVTVDSVDTEETVKAITYEETVTSGDNSMDEKIDAAKDKPENVVNTVVEPRLQDVEDTCEKC